MVDVLFALTGLVALLGWSSAWALSKEQHRLQHDLFKALQICYPSVQRPSQPAEVYDWSKDGL